MSSNIGDSVGRSPQLSTRELETTAANEVAKSLMKIATDTVDLNFFLIDEGVRKYQSSAARPNLTSPLGSVRVATNPSTQSETNWQGTYEVLKKNLPENVQNLLNIALSLPVEQRGANLAVLDNVLQTFAKGLTLLSIATKATDSESLVALRAEANLVAPYVALGSTLRADKVLLAETLSLLSMLGPNYQNFNALSGYMSDFNNVALDIATVATIMQDPTSGTAGMEKLSEVAKDIGALSNKFDTQYGGGDLLLLGSMLHASQVITASLSLDNGQAASAIIALFIASTAIAETKSEAAPIGSSLSTTLNGITNAINEAFVSKGDVASRIALDQLVSNALAGAVILGGMTYRDGTGVSGNENDNDVRAQKNFAFSLMMSMMNGMNIISSFAAGLAEASNLPPDTKEKIGSMLATGALMLMIAAASKKEDPHSLEPLVRDLNDPLKKGVTEIANFVADGLMDGSIRGANWEHSNVYLQQATIALGHGDSAAFLDSMNSILALNHTSLSEIVSDISKFIDFGVSTSAMLKVSADEVASNCTGIYSPA